jgi:23S rRNA pseudouridine1911/1915/1917 synthase
VNHDAALRAPGHRDTDELPSQLVVEVPASLEGERVDRAVALLAGLPRRVVRELMEGGGVKVDGRTMTTRSRALSRGQRLAVDMSPRADTGPSADASVDFAVVFADDQLIVVDKPAGLVVHHGAGHQGGTLVDGLLARFPDLVELSTAGDPTRPGIVHRLDKGTSGLLVVARTADAQRCLARQMRTRSAGRVYMALVAGRVLDAEGVIDAPVGRSLRQPTRMAVSSRGRPARTSYTVQRRYDRPVEATLVEVSLDTGRTHQVRVHMAAIGHPVIGDDRYGPARARPAALVELMSPGRLFLHAQRLSLEHPGGGRLTWESPLPDDLRRVLARLHQ